MSDCKKVRYMKRSDATKARQFIGDRGLRPYKCEPCNSWHLGHLPIAIRRGEKGRREVYGGDEAA